MMTQEDRPSFLDFVRGGLSLNLHCAIDFTASNGEPTHPQSLHFVGKHVGVNPMGGAVRIDYSTKRPAKILFAFPYTLAEEFRRLS